MTTMTTQFDRQARVYQTLTHAKLESAVHALPEPAVTEDLLATLVGIGVLTAEQAKELWKLISGGVGYPLPPVPNPDLGPNQVDVYQVLRVATLIPRDDVTFSVGSTIVDAIVQAVVDIAVREIPDAIGAIGDWISNLFS